MNHFDDRVFNQVDTPVLRMEVAGAELTRRWKIFLKRALQPKYDLDRLSPRLLKDAGIDEIVLERIKAARAPLIR